MNNVELQKKNIKILLKLLISMTIIKEE